MCRYHLLVFLYVDARFGGDVMLDASVEDWNEIVIEAGEEVVRLRAEIDPLRIAYRAAHAAWSAGMETEAVAIAAEAQMVDAIDSHSDAYMLWEALSEY